MLVRITLFRRLLFVTAQGRIVFSQRAACAGHAPRKGYEFQGVPAGPCTRCRREIARVASSLDDLDESHQFEFPCECGDLSCNQFARMTVAEYRASPPGSVVGHPVPGGVHVAVVSQPPMADAAANAHIFLHVRDAADGEQKWEFLCQCGTADCNERAMLTIDAYIALHDRGRRCAQRPSRSGAPVECAAAGRRFLARV